MPAEADHANATKQGQGPRRRHGRPGGPPTGGRERRAGRRRNNSSRDSGRSREMQQERPTAGCERARTDFFDLNRVNNDHHTATGASPRWPPPAQPGLHGDDGGGRRCPRNSSAVERRGRAPRLASGALGRRRASARAAAAASRPRPRSATVDSSAPPRTKLNPRCCRASLSCGDGLGDGGPLVSRVSARKRGEEPGEEPPCFRG